MPDALTAFGLIAAVLLVSALAAGVVERAPLSFPMIFLGLGFALGPHGFDVIALDAHDKTLEVIATSSLALVLFLDAVNLRLDELTADWLLPTLALGPGTVLTIAIVTAGALVLLDASFTQALLLGAILSSTDPVVLRDVVRDTRIPRSVRRALSVEAGTNDVVILPAVLILIAVAGTEARSGGDWVVFLVKLLLLGPVVGFVVGAAGAFLMERADRAFGISRAYQALYGIGLVLAAYTIATEVGSDGFIAAFAAGIAVSALNFELCDCFLEYGEVTAEMTMLLAFVLFGAVLSVEIEGLDLAATLAFALLVILIARPIAFGAVLRRADISPTARRFIAWFGPRGLSSLLLVLLVVHADVADAEWMLAIVGVTVLVSVVAHGASATPLSTWYANKVAAGTLAEERAATAGGLFHHGDSTGSDRIDVEELALRLMGDTPPIVLDVRTRSQYDADQARIPGSVRVLPDQIAGWAGAQDRERSVVAYCT
jgi:NhaP-type Na+/H+ or K+/H+ antiporter